jgi:hypothetical protein
LKKTSILPVNHPLEGLLKMASDEGASLSLPAVNRHTVALLVYLYLIPAASSAASSIPTAGWKAGTLLSFSWAEIHIPWEI